MAEPLIRRDVTGHVARITMNAPASLNALSDDMLAALQAEFDALAKDRSVRAVVLAAEGKAFCAGHNLKEMQAARAADDGGAAAFDDLFRRCARLMLTIQRLPQPVIAEVHANAVAAGIVRQAICKRSKDHVRAP